MTLFIKHWTEFQLLKKKEWVYLENIQKNFNCRFKKMDLFTKFYLLKQSKLFYLQNIQENFGYRIKNKEPVYETFKRILTAQNIDKKFCCWMKYNKHVYKRFLKKFLNAFIYKILKRSLPVDFKNQNNILPTDYKKINLNKKYLIEFYMPILKE